MNLDSTPAPGDDGFEGSEFSYEPPHFSRPRLPEDIQVPWGLSDLVLLVFVALLLTVGVAVFAQLSGVLHASPRVQSVFDVAAQAAIDFLLMACLALQIRLRFNEPFWQTIGWRTLDPGILPRWFAYAGLVVVGMVISGAVTAASNLDPPKGNLPIDSYYRDPVSAALFLMLAVLLAPLVEETIFRGYLYPVIARSWGGAAGVLITGALFGLLHSFQLWHAWWQVALLVGVGIIFTWVRATAKTVVASYCLHVGYNSFLLVGFLASTHFLRSLPPH
jgi:CAAX protease family protein